MKRTSYADNIRGFTLVELIVVIAIISTLLTIATLSFNSWIQKNRIESQVNSMVADFNALRVRAMTRKQRHSITLNATSYVFRSYSSNDEDLFSGGTTLSDGAKHVGFQLKSNSTTLYNGTVLEINDRGLLVSTTTSIYLDSPNNSATIDCLAVHTARTNPGKKNSTWSSCDDR